MNVLPETITRQSLAKALGTEEANVVPLVLDDQPLAPEHLDFLGLVHARGRREPAPDAVVLRNGQALLYVWDMRQRPDLDPEQSRRDLERLALRSDAPYVALLRPGIVQFYALSQSRVETSTPLLESAELHPGLLARLGVGDVPTHASGVDTHDLMLELLNVVTDQLVSFRGVTPDEALALVGRALFLRFLHDRGIIPDVDPMPGVKRFRDCMQTPQLAAASCRWLDETFNGDLLTLPGGGDSVYFASLMKPGRTSALDDLSAIIRGDKPLGDGSYQTPFSWYDLHFSYIPVGLLSQVYEHYIHRFDALSAKRDSVYYTPRHLAEYVVDHAMSMLGDGAHRARVLDPAAGGGVFLLAALRRLVQGRWRATGRQPTTRVIREILNNQLVGIDTNPAARQLSALGLYLTALELDPDVGKLRNLKFDALQGRVLLQAESWIDEPSGLGLGSLSRPIPDVLRSGFDIVLGNPPWTSTGGRKSQKAMDTNARADMVARGVTPASNPDGVPDLPFVWAATQWAKPDGVIAFALHARLLIKTSELGFAARRAVFEGLDVTYVLNGVELRNTPVWPNMTAQFCLLFARNRTSSDQSRFYAVTPALDRMLNQEGRVRIDSKDAWASDSVTVRQIPHLFKTLAKGNALDVDLLEKIRYDSGKFRSRNPLLRPSLMDYANSSGVHHGHGYQVSSFAEDASELRGLPMMPDPRLAAWPVVPAEQLPRFSFERVHRVRDRKIYRAPLVLLRKSPSTRPGAPVAMLAFEDLAYRESYIGFSFAEVAQPELSAVYLWALLNSKLFLYYTLMTSSILGVERSAMQKSDAEQFPVTPLASLEPSQIETLKELLRSVRPGATNVAVPDRLVNQIYGLTSSDIVLIEDRLATAMPFSHTLKNAIAAPNEREVKQYHETLIRILQPFDLSHTPLDVAGYPASALSPWRFLRIGSTPEKGMPSVSDLLGAINMADAMNCSLVEFREGDQMFIGILNQRRYWTRTAARTLALDIIKRNDSILNRQQRSMRSA